MTDREAISELDIMRMRLAAAELARARAELVTARLNLAQAQNVANAQQAATVELYGLQQGDSIEPDGTIVRANNGQAGAAEPAPTPEEAAP